MWSPQRDCGARFCTFYFIINIKHYCTCMVGNKFSPIVETSKSYFLLHFASLQEICYALIYKNPLLISFLYPCILNLEGTMAPPKPTNNKKRFLVRPGLSIFCQKIWIHDRSLSALAPNTVPKIQFRYSTNETAGPSSQFLHSWVNSSVNDGVLHGPWTCMPVFRVNDGVHLGPEHPSLFSEWIMAFLWALNTLAFF